MDKVSTPVKLLAITILAVIVAALIFLISDSRGDTRRAVDWTDPVISSDGKSVTVSYLGGPCQKDAEVEVRESDTSVRLSVFVTDAGGECEDVAITREITAELDAPLGGRTLTHGIDR